MDTMDSLNPDALRSFNRTGWIVTLVLLAALLLLPWLFGIGPNSWRACLGGTQTLSAPASVAPRAAPSPPEPAPAVTPAPAPAPAAPAAAAPATPPAASPAPIATAAAMPTARVFFALDRSELPGNADDALAEVVSYLKANADAKALVSGFHDPRGRIQYNQELALNRARAVRGALERAGIPRDRIAMNKPQETTGTGSNEEARRVEVTIQR